MSSCRSGIHVTVGEKENKNLFLYLFSSFKKIKKEDIFTKN